MTDNQGTPRLWPRLGQTLPRPVVAVYQKYVRPYLPDVSFITLHYLYFITTCMIASVILYGSSTPSQSVRYIDSLFLAVSAMTEAGLNTVNLSTLNTWQQIILFLLIMMGSAIFVSSGVLHIRKSAFEKKLEDLAERRHRRSLHLARSFTFSRSHHRRESVSSRDGAIASGVLRGRAIKDDTMQSEPDPALDQTDQQNGHNSDGQVFEASMSPPAHSIASPARSNTAHIRFGDDVRTPRDTTSPQPQLRRTGTGSRLFTGSGVGVRNLDNHPRNATPMPYRAEGENAFLDEKQDPKPGSFSKIDQWIEELGGFIGRNSQFHGLTEKERRRLGGVEYDAICVLSYVVPIYFVLWQLIGAIGMGAYLQLNRPSETLTNGLNPFWTGAFFAVSAFNNSGMALLDANAVALQTSYYSLLTLSLLILAGNTCFPPFLRLIIWTMRKTIPGEAKSLKWQKRRRILTFILDHPRRVYTNMFPAAQTWWLVFSLVLLNGVDWVAFEILNIGNTLTDAIEPKYRVLDGLFQAFAVRSGGFYVVGIAGLRSGLLVLYVLMMYVSALPVSMTIRNTNVYEERSLGIFSQDQPPPKDDSTDPNHPQHPASHLGVIRTIKRVMSNRTGLGQPAAPSPTWSRQDFVRQQLRGQLGHDLWWLALAILFITIVETGQFERDPVVFSTFNIMFEVVSAYGTVGISTGVPWNFYSFCGAWHTLSKLILCAVMLRGRHRGLPVAIDKAVLLPDETLAWAEEEDARNRRDRGENRLRSARTFRDLESGIEEGRSGDVTRVSTTEMGSFSLGNEEARGRKLHTENEEEKGPETKGKTA